jgi:hypothetical protein
MSEGGEVIYVVTAMRKGRTQPSYEDSQHDSLGAAIARCEDLRDGGEHFATIHGLVRIPLDYRVP